MPATWCLHMAKWCQPGKMLDLFEKYIGLIKGKTAKDGGFWPEVGPAAFKGKEIRQHCKNMRPCCGLVRHAPMLAKPYL